MARWETSIEIDAPAEQVWAVMSDVERWPKWTESIVSVNEVTSEFGMDGSAVVEAKGAPKSRWTVTRWEPSRGFDWATKAMGATTVGGHWIEGRGNECSVTLSIEVKSPLAAILRPFLSRRIVGNMRMEAEGLKRGAESATLTAEAAQR
jgi:uncharacterized membrane protein